MTDKLKMKICQASMQILPDMINIRNDLYHHPETGGKEIRSAKILTDYLENKNIPVIKNYGNIQNAFRAELSSEKPGPTIGLFAEYDALPEIGHGCGHNLICTTSIGAAVSLKDLINELGGKIIIYGTPGEENLCTKTELSQNGMFDESDAGLIIHPNNESCSSRKTRAIEALQIEFFGKSAHAGINLKDAVDAVDAAVECYHIINLRKKEFPEAGIHGIISNGGQKASIIPDYSCLKYLTRAWDMKTLTKLRNMIDECAKEACKLTGCTYRMFNNEPTNRPMLSNICISDTLDKYLTEFGITEITPKDVAGSTDMGDVSWRIPSVHSWVGLNCKELCLHSHEFADKTISKEADAYLEKTIKALACCTAELLTDSKLLIKAKDEFKINTSNKV